MYEVVDQWKRIVVFDHSTIKMTIVLDEAFLSILLGDEEDGRCLFGDGGMDVAFG